jgi:predicted CXXCH cytochrome family protein
MRIVWAGAVIILCASMMGCDPAVRHKVLTTFFDGVPPRETADPEGVRESAELPAAEKKEELKPAVAETLPVIEIHEHPPYAMKMCDSCHEVGTIGPGGAPMGFSLVEERTKLCFMCHDGMSWEELQKSARWVHGPVQAGACIECHHPHESRYPHVLREPEEKLCVRCHDRFSKKNIQKTFAWVHGPVQAGACLECHQPHASEQRYFLRENQRSELCFLCHNEQRLLQTEMHAGIAKAECTKCHDPHGSPERYMMRVDES